MVQTSSTRTPSALPASLSSILPSFENPYAKLPWKLQRIEERKTRKNTLDNAALYRDLGLPADASYENVRDKTAFLIAEAEAAGDIKARIQVEIARDRIYQIRLNERELGLDVATIEAKRASSYDKRDFTSMTDTVDDVIEKKVAVEERSIPIISWLISCIKPPDEKYRNRQIAVWGGISLLCLINPPLVEGASKVQWLPAGGMMGYRGMGIEDMGGGGGGGRYNPFRGRRNKAHQLQAIALSLTVWILSKYLAQWAVDGVEVLKMSRSAEWFKFAIVQSIMGTMTAYIQTFKEDNQGKDLMV